jgi:sterol desaturase/sphingolipid hydroxylase (fatty acid hydroxylase superfamily)
MQTTLDSNSDNASQQASGIRIFKNPLLEAMTHVHPAVPLILWGPIISYFFALFLYREDHTLAQLFWLAPVGLLVWTLTEYTLHRYVFHFPARSKAGKYFVFLFHGLHHDDPHDGTRLVMPPVPAILIVGLIYLIFSLLVPSTWLHGFMAWFLIGYLIYDYIHYATHHWPMTSKVGRYLRAYHLKHHFSGEESRYGVSSPLWDFVFKTVTGPKKTH